MAKAISENNDIKYINKVINGKLSKPLYTSLSLLNEKYDELRASIDSM